MSCDILFAVLYTCGVCNLNALTAGCAAVDELDNSSDYFDDNENSNHHEDLQDHALMEHLLHSLQEAAMVKKGLPQTSLGSPPGELPDLP